MKPFLSILFTAILIIILSPSCSKDSTGKYFIEATINGKKWRGSSSGDYFAAKSDNSQMKIFIQATNPAITNFNFFSNDVLTPYYFDCAEYSLQNAYVAPYDSKLKFKWETTSENMVARYYIVQSISIPEIYQIIDTIEVNGSSSTLKHYSVDLPDVQIPYLNQVKYRILVYTIGGASSYSPAFPAVPAPGGAQIVYTAPNGKPYFPLDNNQNQMSITSYDPATMERSGTFSFNYRDESGNIVEVRNGKFRLKP